MEKQIGKWDFSKLPESEYENVKLLIKQMDGTALLSLHEKYALSSHLYCCGGDAVFVLMYFKEAERKNFFEDDAKG